MGIFSCTRIWTTVKRINFKISCVLLLCSRKSMEVVAGHANTLAGRGSINYCGEGAVVPARVPPLAWQQPNLSPSFPPLLFHDKFHLLKGSSRIRRIIEKERRLTFSFSLFLFFNTCPDSLLFTTNNQSIDFVFCLGKVSFQSIDHGC